MGSEHADGQISVRNGRKFRRIAGFVTALVRAVRSQYMTRWRALRGKDPIGGLDKRWRPLGLAVRSASKLCLQPPGKHSLRGSSVICARSI